MMVYGKNYYFGMSVYNLLEDKLNLSGVDDDANRMFRHYNFMASYLYKVTQLFSLQPSALMRMTEATPGQLDFHLRAIYNGTYWAGMGLRPQDAFVIGTGINYGAFTLAYNYDITWATTTSARIHMNCRLGTSCPCALRSGAVLAGTQGPRQRPHLEITNSELS